MKYSPSTKTAIILLAISTLCAPLPTIAVDSTDSKNARDAGTNASKTSACLAISEKIGTKQKERLEQEKAQREKIRNQIQTKREAELNNFAKIIQTKEQERDQKMAELYAKLENIAKTENQIAGVTKFKTDTKTAIETHKKNIAQIQANFKKDLDELNENNKTKIEASLNNYNNLIETARQTALTACNSGASFDVIQANYAKDRQNADIAINQLKQQTQNNQSQIQSIIQKRKSAIISANETFKTSMEQIKTELLTNFTK